METVELDKQYGKFSKMLDNHSYNIFKSNNEIPEGLWEALTKLINSTDDDESFTQSCPEGGEIKSIYGLSDKTAREWIVKYYSDLHTKFKDSKIEDILEALKPETV